MCLISGIANKQNYTDTSKNIGGGHGRVQSSQQQLESNQILNCPLLKETCCPLVYFEDFPSIVADMNDVILLWRDL